MDKLKRKQSMFGVLKTVAYFVGFPLMMVVVLIGSNQFMHYDIFNKTWFMGLVICAIPWFLACVMQIVFGCFVKSQNLKTIVVAVVVVIVMIGSSLVIDVYGNNVIKDAQSKYSDQKYVSAGVVVDDYKYQVNWYVTLTTEDSLTDKFKVRLEDFCKVYHLEQNGYSWSDINVDGSETKPNSTEKGLGLTNANVSPNGLLGDGWIFSAQNAVDILIAYHEINNKALSAGIDLEADYSTLVAKVKESAVYQNYMDDPAYKKAYVKDENNPDNTGTALGHMIDEERLNQMLPTVAKYLSLAIYDIANLMGDFSYALIDEYLTIDKLGQLETLDDLIAYVNEAIPKIAGLLDGFVGAENNPLRDGEGYLTIEKSFVLNLLEDLAYYVSPTVRPVFDFFSEARDTDDELICEYKNENGEVVVSAAEVQKFAYARYYAKVHGANIGSVLIGDNIGAITMTTSGYPSTYAYDLPALYQLDADLSYIPQLYPIFVARRYLYVFAGICALSIILFYHFAKREEDVINEIVIDKAKGGAK